MARLEMLGGACSLLVLGLCAGAGMAAELAPARVFFVGKAGHVSPATGESREYKLWRLIPVSQTRYLALLDKGVVKFKENRPGPRERVVAPAPVVREEGLLVAMLNKEGKVLLESPLFPHSPKAVVPGAWQHSQLVVMEEESACPYGLLHRGAVELHCFDWQLQPLGKHPVPLESFWAAEAVVGLGRPEVWVFGEWEGPKVLREGKASPSSVDGFRPESQGTVVLRLVPATGEAVPLRDVAGQVRRQAAAFFRQQLGAEKQLVGLRFDPLRSTSGAPAVGGVELLVTATWKESGHWSGEFAGGKSFFLARLGPEGVSRWRRLALQFLQEPEREELEVGPEPGVVRVPGVSWFRDVGGFALGGGRVALVFLTLMAPEGLEQARREGSAVAGVLALCDPSGCELFTDIKGKAFELSTEEVKVLGTPILLGPFGRSQLAFAARCVSKRDRELLGTCAAVLELRP